MERFSQASNGRLAVNEDGAHGSHEVPAKSTRSGDDKKKFREVREDWADSGCLPEGPEPENDNEQDKTEKLRLEKTQEIMQRLTNLQLNLSLGKATKEELNDFVTEITSLRSKKLITEAFYREAMKVAV